MADSIQFQLSGLDAVLTKMRGLAPDLRAKGARSAMRKAANLVRDAAVVNAQRIDDPETKESIAKNIVVRFSSRTLKTTGDVMMRVGVLGGARPYSNTRENVRKRRVGKTYKTGGDKGNPGGDTFYWRFVEFGTSRTAAKPFMRPALEQNIETATSAATTELSRSIDRYAAKARAT
jgi:HK97 gp10 family phage protein